MKINTFLETTAKPALYEKGTKRMWTDSHISSQLLSVHLDGAIDLASRRSEVIESTVEWLLKQRVREKGETLTILDLGCGPGLYAESLARRGHRVTGMDFSARSIEYARGRRRSEGLGIDYRHGDYLKLDGSLGTFDLIIMIYTDFGVLDVRERKTLLGHVASCLKPGGLFIFDVLKDKDLPSRVEAPAWECRKEGFWLETPYLALSSSFLYEKERVILSQHAIWNPLRGTSGISIGSGPPISPWINYGMNWRRAVSSPSPYMMTFFPQEADGKGTT